jgi:hypothetical protein
MTNLIASRKDANGFGYGQRGIFMQSDIAVVGENSFRLGMYRKSAERPKEAKHPRE